MMFILIMVIWIVVLMMLVMILMILVKNVACCTYLHPNVMNCSLDILNLVIRVTSHVISSIHHPHKFRVSFFKCYIWLAWLRIFYFTEIFKKSKSTVFIRYVLSGCRMLSKVLVRFSKWLQSVKKSVINLFLCIAMAYNVFPCTEIIRNTQMEKIAVFTM